MVNIAERTALLHSHVKLRLRFHCWGPFSLEIDDLMFLYVSSKVREICLTHHPAACYLCSLGVQSGRNLYWYSS